MRHFPYTAEIEGTAGGRDFDTEVVIGSGLTRNLQAVLGDCDGFGNLRILLMGLLPLAINVKASVGISDEEEVLDTIHHHLQGTFAISKIVPEWKPV